MEYTITNIASLSSLRKMAKDVGAEEFIKFAEKVMTISDKVEAQLKEAERELEEKKNKLKERFAQIQADGFTGIDEAGFIDLFLNQSKDKAVQIDNPSLVTKSAPEPKYAYIDKNDVELTWTGRGRIPAALEIQLKDEHGNTLSVNGFKKLTKEQKKEALELFLIKNDSARS